MQRLSFLFLILFPFYSVGKAADDCVHLEANFIENQLKHTQSLINNIRLQPRSKNSEPLGYEILHIRENSKLTQLKLEERDIITKLEDTPFINSSNLANTLVQLAYLPTFTLTLLRDEKELNILYINTYDMYCE